MSTAVIFDLDDTLYPERQFAHGGFRAAAQWAADVFDLVPEQQQRLVSEMCAALDRGVLGALFGPALRAVAPTATDADVKEFLKAYGRAMPKLELFPDAERFLSCPKAAMVRGLITDGHAATQQKKVASLGRTSHSHWQLIFTGALGPDRQFHKPHPRAFEMMAQAAIDTTRLVYVGDNVSKDFIAPNALGWTTVHVVRENLGANERRIHSNAVGEPPIGGAPHITIASLDELTAIL